MLELLVTNMNTSLMVVGTKSIKSEQLVPKIWLKHIFISKEGNWKEGQRFEYCIIKFIFFEDLLPGNLHSNAIFMAPRFFLFNLPGGH